MQKALFVLLLACSGVARASTVVRDAAVINVGREDLRNLALGAKEEIFGVSTTQGVFEIPYGTGFDGLYPDRIRYDFEVPDADLVPGYGTLTLKATVRNLHVEIDNVYLDEGRTRGCHNLRASSLSSDISLSIEMVPQVDYTGRMTVRFGQVDVDLSRQNFYIHGVSSCSVLGPIDGIIARMIPGIANTMQAQLRDYITRTIIGFEPTVNQKLSDLFTTEFTVPLAVPGFPRRTAHIRTFPTAFESDDLHARLVLGTEGGFYPPHGFRKFVRPQNPRVSYVGLSPDFVNAVLAEALRQGVLDGKLDASMNPDLAILFQAETLYELIPDAATRFASEPEAPLQVQVLGADGLTFVPDPQPDPAHQPFHIDVDHLGLQWQVKNEPYYDLHTSGPVTLAAAFDIKTAHLSLALQDMKGLKLDDGDFVPGLTPPPAPGTGLSPEMWAQFTDALTQMITGTNNGKLIDLRLPEIRIGNTWSNYRSFGRDGDFLVFDIWWRRI